MTQEQFNVQQLLDAARNEAGLSDFGEDEFLPGLEFIVHATNEHAALHDVGRQAFPAELRRWLVNRLRFVDDLKRHPEILEQNVDDPLIILGLPRTGTTKLHRALAADPDTLSIKFWQTLNPSRLSPTQNAEPNPRVELAQQAIDALSALAPELMLAHPVQADFVEEEMFLMTMTCSSAANCFVHPTPGFYEWVSQRSERGTYRFLKRYLQYLQWQQGGRGGRGDATGERPWVLKAPIHLGNLDLLLDTFPQATYVFNHRNLEEVLPSFCHLMALFWRLRIDDVDRHAIGRFNLEFWSREMQKHLAQRERFADRVNILDIPYARVKGDVMAVVRDVYRHSARELTPRREQAIRAWIAADTHGKQGSYRYAMEDFGLSPDGIRAAFAEYCLRFEV